MNPNDFRAAGYVTGGAVLGFVCGYLLHRHLSVSRFDARLAEEIASVKTYYRARAELADSTGTGHSSESGQPAKPAMVLIAGDPNAMGTSRKADPGHDPARNGPETGRRTAYHTIRSAADAEVAGDPGHESDVGTTVSIGEEGEADENPSGYDADFYAGRDTSRPYPISVAEFSEEHDDWAKLTITYYEADKVLADDKDVPIADIVGTIGPDGLRFGYGSDDENIVNVRNEKLEIDFEVTRDYRSYSEVILGYGNPRLTARAKQGEL